MKKSLQFLLATFILTTLFSCNVLDITKKRYSNGYYISSTKNKKSETINKKGEIAKSDATDNNEITEVVPTDAYTASLTTEPSETMATEKVESVELKSTHKRKSKILHKSQVLLAIKASNLMAKNTHLPEKKVAEKHNSKTKGNAEVELVLLVILCFLLPPIAVLLKDGLSTLFWISLLLTLLFWVPGVIFALLVVLDAIE